MSIPRQTDVKALLSEVVSRGARKRIAHRLGIAESDLSRRFSVNDERKSGIGEGLREASAIAEEDPSAFGKVKAYLQSILEALEPQPKEIQLSLPLLVCQIHKEAADVFQAYTLDRPAHEQVKEASEAIAALQRFIATHTIARKPDQIAPVRRTTQRLRKTG